MDEDEHWRIEEIRGKLAIAATRIDIDANIYCDDVGFLLQQIEFLLDLVEAKADDEDDWLPMSTPL